MRVVSVNVKARGCGLWSEPLLFVRVCVANIISVTTSFPSINIDSTTYRFTLMKTHGSGFLRKYKIGKWFIAGVEACGEIKHKGLFIYTASQTWHEVQTPSLKAVSQNTKKKKEDSNTKLKVWFSSLSDIAF